MSAYFKKGKGWRYDFTLAGNRHTEAWFTTKRNAQVSVTMVYPPPRWLIHQGISPTPSPG